MSFINRYHGNAIATKFLRDKKPGKHRLTFTIIQKLKFLISSGRFPLPY